MGKKKERKGKREPSSLQSKLRRELPRELQRQPAPGRLRLPDQPQLERLVQEVLRTAQGKVPPEEAKESESWLDWGLDLIKKWGPMLLEAAPELIALL